MAMGKPSEICLSLVMLTCTDSLTQSLTSTAMFTDPTGPRIVHNLASTITHATLVPIDLLAVEWPQPQTHQTAISLSI